MASEEAPLFDTTLKKKSKNKILDVDAELGLTNEDEAAETVTAPAAKGNAKLGNTDDTDDNKPKTEQEEEDGEDARAADEQLAAMFGGLKKKKKASKKTQFLVDLDNLPARRAVQGSTPAAAPAPVAAAATEQVEAVEPAEPATEAGATAAEVTEDGDLNFGELKKKKKSSKTKSTKLAEFEKELAEGAEGDAADAEEDEEDDEDGPDGTDQIEDQANLGDNPFAADFDEDGEAAASGSKAKTDADEAWIGSDRDYLYPELLGRIFRTLRQHNPALSGDKKKYTIVPPSVQREGSKKTLFANSLDICKRMHREPEHVYAFLFAELGTLGNIDGSQRLIIKGRFQPKQIENVLRKYIGEFLFSACRVVAIG